MVLYSLSLSSDGVFSFPIGLEVYDFHPVASGLVGRYGTAGVNVLHLPCMDFFSERFDSLEFISSRRYKIIQNLCSFTLTCMRPI